MRSEAIDKKRPRPDGQPDRDRFARQDGSVHGRGVWRRRGGTAAGALAGRGVGRERRARKFGREFDRRRDPDRRGAVSARFEDRYVEGPRGAPFGCRGRANVSTSVSQTPQKLPTDEGREDAHRERILPLVSVGAIVVHDVQTRLVCPYDVLRIIHHHRQGSKPGREARLLRGQSRLVRQGVSLLKIRPETKVLQGSVGMGEVDDILEERVLRSVHLQEPRLA